ncbi:EAL domain-containing protein [Caulobacter henricii]|uniref:Histidine kinase n=1 Tax=Caulobacter henricii TaxID=69395 RepID=A0A0P0NXH5_9CAUL|nr:EAL domain-containing protein [Caulobacter henricii]ALL12780.1 histidine kinase [Caulobacter henricii]
MSIDPRRLLGLAFASADLLVEIRDGTIDMALGAAQRIVGLNEAALTGKVWRDLFCPSDQALMDAIIACADDGARRGPVIVRLAGPTERHVSVVMRALPENGGRLSCALTTSQAPSPAVGSDGLHPRESFEDIAKGLFEAARVTGIELELAMIEFAGLGERRAALPQSEAEVLDAHVAGAVRAESHGGAAATRLSDDRYAVVRAKDENTDNLTRRLSHMLELDASAHVVSLEPGNASARSMRALRYALDDFLSEGLKDTPPMSLAEAMNRSVKRTLARAGALGVAVSQRRFNLAYQPVVNLATGEAHHHEVLVRFEEGASPFALIRMAEEFDLIEELDHAIVEQATRRLAQDRSGDLKLAVNVSGRTIVTEGFVDHVSRLLAKFDQAKGRLIFEITESAAIDDLPRANRHIQSLRGMGSLVCLDDFGSGAASFAYLQELSLDIVKIDGRYVRELAANGREGAMVRRLVEMCRDLKIRTVAEMIESAEVEDVVRDAGVDFGQGWLYGKPADMPKPALKPPSAVKTIARRAGASESWG